MLSFLSAHTGDLIVGTIIGILIVLALCSIRRQHKTGRSSCGGDCARCAGGCKLDRNHTMRTENRQSQQYASGNRVTDAGEKDHI